MRGQGRRELLAAHRREGLGDGGLGAEDDRLGRHQAAGGVLVVGEQPPQRGGLVGLHELEQLLGLLRRQLGEQVGGVVGLHRLEHVGGALVGEAGEDLDLVVLGQLLEDVGERSSSRAAATSARRLGLRSWMTSARSATLRSS